MGSAKVATMKLLLALCPLFASATPTIWPMPSSLVENGANLTVGASTTFFVEKAAVAGSSSSSSSSALLTEAFTRYTSLTFPHGITFDDTDQVKVKDSKELTSLVVSVEELDESHPQLSTDETYTLSISSSGVKLTAPTVYGALKGLETFSQLVLFDLTHALTWCRRSTLKTARASLTAVSAVKLTEIGDPCRYYSSSFHPTRRPSIDTSRVRGVVKREMSSERCIHPAGSNRDISCFSSSDLQYFLCLLTRMQA